MKSTFLPISLIIISIALLIPGITEPMLTINGTMDKQVLKDTGVRVLAESMVDDATDDPRYERKVERAQSMINGGMRMFGIGEVEGTIEAYQKTRSISGTIKDLYQANNTLVAFLVALFSIVIPVCKLLMLLTAVLIKSSVHQNKLVAINSLLSKWSMADVFVVAIIVTYMAAHATSAAGPTGETLLQFNAQFEIGFYYFTAYCLFAIASASLISKQCFNPKISDKSSSYLPTSNVTQPAVDVKNE